ncbi:MAG: hypothetical protein AAFX06_32600 [Planctomycetota bacterium]
MSAFILECLSSTGWKRSGELFWRLRDAEAAAKRRTSKGRVRAVRVLPVEISPEAVFAIEHQEPATA